MNQRILINGVNAKSGGGKSILINLLQKIREQKNLKQKFYVLTPNKNDFESFTCEHIKIVDIANIYKKNIFFIGLFFVAIPRLIRTLRIESILNLSNIPIPTRKHQVFLFQWAYAVYPESSIWDKMDLKNKTIRKIKIFFFKRNAKYIDVCIAQSNSIKKRLEKLYGLVNIQVIPNSITFSNNPKNLDSPLPKGTILVYLSYYYPHKNFEILISFAERIKREKLSYKIVTTIEKSQHKGAKDFLRQVYQKNLQNIIYNIGPVPMNQIGDLYSKSDALLMPTILESYGLTYFEAMNYKLPIIASRMDFSISACKDAALYFSPFDSKELLKVTNDLFENEDLRQEIINNGNRILNNLPTWDQLINEYLRLLKN